MPDVEPARAGIAGARLATLGGDRCPVCGSVVEIGADLGDYALYACRSCASWCSDAAIRGAATTFEPVDYFRHAGVDASRWDALLARASREGRPLTSVLDVGCGTGAFLAHLRDRHATVRRVGIERDADRASSCRSADPDVEIHVGDALEALDELEGLFDLVTLWDVFEHVPDPGGLLEALATRLAEGGRIYVQTIHEQSILPALGRASYRLTGGRVRQIARRTHEAHHLVFFSRSGLVRLVERAGLETVDLWFDRLARARMDGAAPLKWAASLLLAAENAWGNGLFVNLLLERRRP
jgi:2-polyprenyl-3-methyl-5-hydroxy-6-metoxy-1,4-benzoquinol methylase